MLEELQRYDWPGNIRELRDVIERANILSTEGTVRLPDDMTKTVSASNDRTAFPTLSQNELQHIAAALKKCNDVIRGHSGAARLLDVNANTLRSRMEKLGMRSDKTTTEVAE